MNKKGWIRIIEASIAVLIILSALIIVSQIRQAKSEKDISESISPMLEEIAKNTVMREQIITDTDDSDEAEEMIRQFIGLKLKNQNIGYNVTICESDKVCGLGKYPTGLEGNMYAGSRIISSILATNDSPKKVTLFLWARG